MKNGRDQSARLKQRDEKIWAVIFNFYKNRCSKYDFEKTRLDYEKEAYWCRPAKKEENQKLFEAPEQRLMARFIKSYLNDRYHTIQPQQEKWFDKSDIIGTIRNLPAGKDKLICFSKNALSILEGIEWSKYEFDQEQIENFEKMKNVIENKYKKYIENKNCPKTRRVSRYERIIIDQINVEPYKTILKMQKILPDYGIALSCDFLKESHLFNIAKPDIHLCHVFSVIDKIQYSSDLVLAKRIADFAENAGCRPEPENFCNTGSYYIDKIIWMLCSRSKTDKRELMEKIAVL